MVLLVRQLMEAEGGGGSWVCFYTAVNSEYRKFKDVHSDFPWGQKMLEKAMGGLRKRVVSEQ